MRPLHILTLPRLLGLPILTVIIACGGDTSNPAVDGGTHDGVKQQDALMQHDAAVQDSALDQDGAVLPVDSGQQDQGTADTGTADWPPPGPYHSGKTCTLPPCDPNGPVAVDLSGTWSQQLTTETCDCNAMVISMRPELQTGHVMTRTGLTNPRSGECVYDSDNPGQVVGVIKGNIMITCQVLPPEMNVTPVVESVMTFGDGTATGTAWTYLFDVPLPPATCSAKYAATMTRE